MSATTLTPTTTGTLAVSGAHLAYEVAGAGPALVLLHAGVADARMWDAQALAFAERFTVIRYDLRGFGRSGAAIGRFSHRADLLALLDALGVGRASLVGLSMGGSLAVDMALAHPDRVAAVVAAAARPSGQEASPELRGAWAAIDAAVGAGDLDRAVELELRMWVDGPYRSPAAVDPAVREFVGLMDAPLLAAPDEGDPEPLDPPALGRLADIATPTLVIVGDRDQPDTIAGSHLLAAGIPGAARLTIPGVAHLINLERPDAFRRAVLEFLAGIDTGS